MLMNFLILIILYYIVLGFITCLVSFLFFLINNSFLYFEKNNISKINLLFFCFFLWFLVIPYFFKKNKGCEK